MKKLIFISFLTLVSCENTIDCQEIISFQQECFFFDYKSKYCGDLLENCPIKFVLYNVQCPVLKCVVILICSLN